MSRIYIDNGRIVGTKVRSQISGSPPGGTYIHESEIREAVERVRAKVQRYDNGGPASEYGVGVDAALDDVLAELEGGG